MKVFISWSGAASRAVAELLRTYLPCMLQGVHPFLSSHDLASGIRWNAQLTKELDEATFGIICLTPDNLHNDWILFEAGALTKHVDGRACCLLFQKLAPADVSGPLAQFQNRMFGRSEFAKLLTDINALSTTPLSESSLQMVFEKWWPDIESNVHTAHDRVPQAGASTKREPSDIFEEILLGVRHIQSQLTRSSVHPGASAAATATEPPAELENERYFTVSLARFRTGGPDVLVRLDPQTTFQRFLNQMYSYLGPYVPPFTYGLTWVLRDIETGEVVSHARMRADHAAQTTITDHRRLTDIGIRPGSNLEAILTVDLHAA